MLRKTALALMLSLYVAASAAQGQQSKTVAPPPKPKDDGPSLEVTMKFIQDKLGEQTPLAFKVASSVDSDVIYRIRAHRSDVVADPTTCSLKGTITSVQEYERPAGFPENNTRHTFVTVSTILLKDVEKITVDTMEESSNRQNAKQGYPERTIVVTPPIFGLVVSTSKPIFPNVTYTHNDDPEKIFDPNPVKEVTYNFDDEEMANRIAKAMLHAVELCGGGNKDPF